MQTTHTPTLKTWCIISECAPLTNYTTLKFTSSTFYEPFPRLKCLCMWESKLESNSIYVITYDTSLTGSITFSKRWKIVVIRSVRVFILGCGILLLMCLIQLNIIYITLKKIVSHYFGRVELIWVLPLHILLLGFLIKKNMAGSPHKCWLTFHL